MSVGKVAITDAAKAVAARVSLVGVVRGSRRGWRIDEDRSSGEAQQLGEQRSSAARR